MAVYSLKYGRKWEKCAERGKCGHKRMPNPAEPERRRANNKDIVTTSSQQQMQDFVMPPDHPEM